LKEIYSFMFDLAIHYKVAYFCIEDLSIKPAQKDVKVKEFNRKVNNIWKKDLQINLVKKHCNINGIIYREVSPAYSSFIGNMVYNEYDPIASAHEICRRGMNSYIKGCSIYPDISSINQEKLNYLLGENVDSSWNKLYKTIINSGLRYRNKDKKSLSVNKFKSFKSQIEIFD